MKYNSKYIDIYKKLDAWITNNNFKSYDVCQIDALPFFMFINSIKSRFKYGHYFTFLIDKIKERHQRLLRTIFRIKKLQYVQAQSIIARSYLTIYKKINDAYYLQKAIQLLEWIVNKNSNKTGHRAWGQPYDWYSGKKIIANTPRATVTAQVIHAILDAYEVTNKKHYLNIAISTCKFFIHDFKKHVDKDGDICFSYTNLHEDSYVHNANILISSVLLRTYGHSNNNDFLEMGLKSLKYTMKYQNDDGSWYYNSPESKTLGRIDNYHTGFVIESLYEIKKVLNTNFEFDKQYLLGIEFYYNNFFTKNKIAKLTPSKIYPIDIQCCAQSIITFALLHDLKKAYSKLAEDLVLWTIENMMDKEGFFYYRIYKNGFIDKSPYIRWAQSWMLRALSLLI